jgi:RNA polymerase sigma-70 factor (ECF subfamily)
MPCDWAHIAALYGELTRLTGSPVVELNRAIAIAETDAYRRARQLTADGAERRFLERPLTELEDTTGSG